MRHTTRPLGVPAAQPSFPPLTQRFDIYGQRCDSHPAAARTHMTGLLHGRALSKQPAFLEPATAGVAQMRPPDGALAMKRALLKRQARLKYEATGAAVLWEVH